MIKVYIYDDNEARRESLRAMLDLSSDFEFVGASSNCNHAINDMSIAQPDVVLMDIEMPGTDGIEGVKNIKSKYPHIKIIMQTVFEESEKIFAALRNGAEGYLLKTASVTSIMYSIKEVYNGGAFMTPSVAIRVIRLFDKPIPERQILFEKLSPKENQVLQFLAKGLSYKMIANQLNITAGTVNNHIKKIYEKLQVHSAVEAINLVHKSNFM